MTQELPPHPANLELDDWLQFSLESEDETYRLLALKEIRRTGCSSSLLPHLQRIYKTDASPPCRGLAQEILLQEKVRSQRAKFAATLDLSPQTLTTYIQETHPIMARLLCQALRKSPSKEILDVWRATLSPTTAPTILEAGLTILGRFGTPQDTALAEPFLSHEDPGTVCAALDLFHHHDPEMLQVHICPALGSDCPEIRLHAIRRLAGFDPSEALKFIADFLESPDPFFRQLGIPELMLLPFEVSERTFIHFLAREEMPLLLVTAGLGLCSNPAPRVPEKVYAIFLSSVGPKAAILQTIFRMTVSVIQAAGILQEPMETYMAGLKKRLEKTKSEIRIRVALSELENPEPDVRLAAIQSLQPHLESLKVKTALEFQVETETDPEVKNALCLLLGLQPPPPPETISLEALEKELADGTFSEQPPDRQQRLLGQINSRDAFRRLRTHLLAFDTRSLKKAVFFEFLHRFERYARPEDFENLFPLLDDPDPGRIAAAIKTIGVQRYEAVLKKAPTFLAHDDPRVKKAILELYLTYNREGAFGYLKEMLSATNSTVKTGALNLLAMMDFPTAEPILREFLRKEKDEKARIHAGMLFVSNISEDSLYQVYQISHTREGAAIPSYKALWVGALEAAEAVLSQDRGRLQAEMVQRLETEKAIKAAPPPGYAFDNYRRSNDDIKTTIRVEKEAETAKADLTFAIVLKILFWGTLAIGFPLWYYFFSFLPRQTSSGPGMEAAQPLASGTTGLASGTTRPAPSNPLSAAYQKIKEALGLEKSQRRTLEIK
jgi:hypothetical protein